MKAFLDELCKIIPVRALIALCLTGVYAYLACSGKIESKAFENVVIMIVSFYFGTASNRSGVT